MSARIKICGLTRAEDARVAAGLGVDAVGVVLWPGSPRAATLEQAAAVSAAVPPTTMRVGVFVRPTLDEIATAIAAAGLTAVQIHGADDPAPYRDLPVPVIWAAALREGAPVPVTPDRMTLLLDAYDPVQHGGTGRTIDWSRAHTVALREPRLILAGGLTPDNVAHAVAAVRPWGVDVSSGVETAPGIKSPACMQAFVAAVRRVPTSTFV